MADFLDGVEDCRVISTAKVLTDFTERAVGKTTPEIHANLPRENDGAGSTRGVEV